jgi:hypothetical protein
VTAWSDGSTGSALAFRSQQDLPVGFRPCWVDGGSQSSWPVAGVDDVDVAIRTSIKVGSGVSRPIPI